MMPGAKLRATLYLMVVAVLAFQARAFLPYPSNYVVRLYYLDGWPTKGYYGFNCSALIANAHGERYLTEREFWAGADGRLRLIAEFPDRYHIDEARIQVGDAAVFQGPTAVPYLGRGLHVAAYLGDGQWIDADTRRGYVAKHPLNGIPDGDPWFQGKVRIVRWKDAAQPRCHVSPVAENFFVTSGRNDYRLQDHFAEPTAAILASKSSAKRLANKTEHQRFR